MKSNAFAKVLESYATKLPPNSSQDWFALARLFNSAKTKVVVDFCRELSSLAPAARLAEADGDAGVIGLGALVAEIRPMRAMADALGKAPLATALEELRLFIEQYPSTTAQGLELALAEKARVRESKPQSRRQPKVKDPSIVLGYERRLDEALGDDMGFDEVVAQLEGDRRLNAADIKQLAKAFAGRSGGSKGEAIEAIKARHRNLMDARAKQRFNTGQTAA